MMELKKGICKNINNCNWADRGLIQEAPSSDFTCLECGRPLEQIPEGKKDASSNSSPKKHTFFIAVAVAIALMGTIAAIIICNGSKAESPKACDQNITMNTTVAQAYSDSMIASEKQRIIDNTPTTDSTVSAIKQQQVDNKVPSPESTATHKARDKRSSTQSPSTPKVSLSYASYNGDEYKGLPHGNGTMSFRQDAIIPGTVDCMASPGEKVVGIWRDGKINMGTWYRNDSTHIVVKLGQRYGN